MLLLGIAGFFALLFALGGFLVWLGGVIIKRRPSGRRVFTRTALGLAVFLVLFFLVIFPLLASYAITGAGTRPMDQRLGETPETYGRDFADVEFSSRDGLRLAGWYLPAESEQPAFILSHGLFRNRNEVLERACALNGRGYPVLLFDFRSHGRSDSAIVSLGFRERLDVLGAVDYLSRRGHDRVVLMGVSMGAVASLLAAPECSQAVEAVVADSPFLNLMETVSRHAELFLGLPSFPFAQVFSWNLCRLAGFDGSLLDTARAAQATGGAPVLLIYGGRDARMPEETARRVYQAIPHHRKQIVFFEDAGHGRSFREEPERYLDTVVAFVKKYGTVKGTEQPES